LLERLEEAFTRNRLKLTPALMGCLRTTNITENPNVAGRICRWRDRETVLHWMASEYLPAEKSLCPSHGYRDVWVLTTALGRARSTSKVDLSIKAAQRMQSITATPNPRLPAVHRPRPQNETMITEE